MQLPSPKRVVRLPSWGLGEGYTRPLGSNAIATSFRHRRSQTGLIQFDDITAICPTGWTADPPALRAIPDHCWCTPSPTTDPPAISDRPPQRRWVDPPSAISDPPLTGDHRPRRYLTAIGWAPFPRSRTPGDLRPPPSKAIADRHRVSPLPRSTDPPAITDRADRPRQYLTAIVGWVPSPAVSDRPPQRRWVGTSLGDLRPPPSKAIADRHLTAIGWTPSPEHDPPRRSQPSKAIADRHGWTPSPELGRPRRSQTAPPYLIAITDRPRQYLAAIGLAPSPDHGTPGDLRPPPSKVMGGPPSAITDHPPQRRSLPLKCGHRGYTYTPAPAVFRPGRISYEIPMPKNASTGGCVFQHRDLATDLAWPENGRRRYILGARIKGDRRPQWGGPPSPEHGHTRRSQTAPLKARTPHRSQTAPLRAIADRPRRYLTALLWVPFPGARTPPAISDRHYCGLGGNPPATGDHRPPHLLINQFIISR